MHEDLKKLIEEGEKFEAMARKTIADHEQAASLSLWEKMERLGRDVRRLRDARSEFSQAAGVFPKAQK